MPDISSVAIDRVRIYFYVDNICFNLTTGSLDSCSGLWRLGLC